MTSQLAPPDGEAPSSQNIDINDPPAKTSKHDDAKQTAHSSTPLFQARKRSRKATKRRLRSDTNSNPPTDKATAEQSSETTRTDNNHNEGNDPADPSANTQDDGPSHADLLLLREAQQLREKARAKEAFTHIIRPHRRLRPPSPSSANAQKNSGTVSHNAADNDANAVAHGLSSQFSVERSGHALEQRMHNFIEEGMRRKFGGNENDRSSAIVADDVRVRRVGEHGDDEEDVFDIPRELQVTPRPLYDPSDGMPSAGLEEVAVSNGAREETAIATQKAAKRLHERRIRRPSASDRRGVDEGEGNFSANFQHHRNEWIETHVGGNNDCRIEGGGGRGRRGDRLRQGECEDDHGGRGTSGVKRFGQASDAAFAERFRKRWRR